MQPDITISEENLKTPESREMLRYILDRGEVQVEFNVRMRDIEQRLIKLNLDKKLWTNYLGFMIQGYKGLLDTMTTRDALVDGALVLRGYLSDFEKLVGLLEDEAKKPDLGFEKQIKEGLYGYNNFIFKVMPFYEKVDKLPAVIPKTNYAEIGPGEMVPVWNEDQKSTSTVKLDDLGLLSRLRGDGKSGVLEVLQGVVGEGGHAIVVAVPYKVTKHGNHDTQVLTHGVDTSYEYLDKITSDRKLFRAETEFLPDLPHTRYKESMEGHALMRNLPNTELQDILYDEEKKLVIEPKKAGDFFIQFGSNLFQAYQQQIEDRKIVHRDIKPHNIRVELLGTDKGPMIGEINFIDFNVSHRLDASSFGGSPYYSFSPEVAKKLPDAITATTASDVYALGIILVETVVNLAGYGKELEKVREQFADAFNEELERLTNGGKPNPEYLDKLFFTKRQNLIRLLEQSLERTDLTVHERKKLQILIDQMLSSDPKDRPTISQTLKWLADLDFQHTKTKTVESYFEHEIEQGLSNAESQLKMIQDELKQKMARKDLLINNNNNTKESFTKLVTLQAEIQDLENKKAKWEKVIQTTKDELMQPHLKEETRHSALLETHKLSAVRDEILPPLQEKLAQLRTQKSDVGILQNFSQLKSAFSEIKDQDQITARNIDYLMRNLGIKAFRDVREWTDVGVKLDNLEFGLKQNIKLLNDYYREIQKLIKQAEDYPKFDVSKLKTTLKEVEEFYIKIQQTPTDVDSMSKALEKMKKRNNRIHQALAPEAAKIVALELDSTKREFLKMLDDESQTKKSGFLKTATNNTSKEKQRSELSKIIEEAKDKPSLIGNVQKYVSNIEEGFFHYQGYKKRMAEAIENVNKKAEPTSDMRNRND